MSKRLERTHATATIKKGKWKWVSCRGNNIKGFSIQGVCSTRSDQQSNIKMTRIK
jgi:hypothetical protein